MKTLGIAVINNNNNLSNNVRNTLFTYYSRYLYQQFNSPDEALKILADEYEYASLIWQGVFIRNHGLYELEISNQIANNTSNWLLCGHIMDEYKGSIFYFPKEKPNENNYFYLYPISVLINLKIWNEIGRPKFGGEQDVPIECLYNLERSKDNVHDTYTPLYLKPNEPKISKKQSSVHVKFGWNIINESIKNKYTVYNISEPMRKYQQYTYPENNVELYNHSFGVIQSLNSKRLSEPLITTINELHTNTYRVPIFNIFNTEKFDLNPLTEDRLNFQCYKKYYKDIDCIINTCQGFKDFIFAFGRKCPHRHNVIFIHYDYNESIIRKREQFIKNWDGRLESLLKYSNKDTPQRPIGLSRNKIKEKYNELIDNFNDILIYEDALSDFVTQWQKYKKSKHFYITQNLFDEYKNKKIKHLIEKINVKNVLFLYSDIFQWEHNILLYGIDGLLEIERNTVQHIKQGLDILMTESKELTFDGQLFRLI